MFLVLSSPLFQDASQRVDACVDAGEVSLPCCAEGFHTVSAVMTTGPIRRPERRERMGVDKNSSRRMNSAYTPNSQLRSPTRTCQGGVVTTDLPTLGTSPNTT
jgi:hypothetical protein